MKVVKLALLFTWICLSVGLVLADTPIRVEQVHSLPFTLLDEPAFLPSDRYQPAYFCVISDIPLDLPPGEGEKSFQMLQGMLGISWDPIENQYVVKQLKLFQAVTDEAQFKGRTTKRIFLLPEKPTKNDWSALHIESDAKAANDDTERRTVLHLDRKTGTGYVRNILWKTSDRTQEPFFDNSYKFRYVPVVP